ncbi:MAG: hypothetical protein ACK5LX_08845 [Oscillospiraceae bacterium]
MKKLYQNKAMRNILIFLIVGVMGITIPSVLLNAYGEGLSIGASDESQEQDRSLVWDALGTSGETVDADTSLGMSGAYESLGLSEDEPFPKK